MNQMSKPRATQSNKSLVSADGFNYRTEWLCEKWSQEAVDFATKRLQALGIEDQLAGYMYVPTGYLTNLTRAVFNKSPVHYRPIPRLLPVGFEVTSANLRKYVGPAEETQEIHGNLLVNEGIQRLMDMTMIATVTNNQTASNPWSNGNSYLGVGDSVTAEAATQTELQAATNRFYKAMNATFPSRSSQTSSFQSDFTTSEANYVWAEWSIAAGATTASGAGFTTGTTNLNRKVAALGTKATGTWTLTGQITIS
jgi:hypothetical protein